MGMETLVKKSDYSVAILLSTYNSGCYLADQIKSIFSQTYKNWKLYIRDDGSTDGTVNLIEKYANQDDRIEFINSNSIKNIGVIKSFFYLLNRSDADFYMFCDQDDVWLNNKVEISVKAILEKGQPEIPVLVHTDLKVVDKDLNVISNSFIKRQRLKKTNKLSNLLVQNNVTGCTVLINNKLKKLLATIPNGVMMHDWWMALVATSLGKVFFIDQPTILYRQHGNNAVGSRNIIQKVFLGYRLRTIKSDLINILNQDSLFLKKYSKKLTVDQKSLVKKVVDLLTYSPFHRINIVNKYDIKKSGALRCLLFNLCLLIFKVKR